MKYLIVGIWIAVFGLYFFGNTTWKDRQPITTPIVDTALELVKNPTSTMIPSVDDDGHAIAYAFVQAEAKNVALFSNLKQSTDSASAKTSHGCMALINAGFYTKEHTHLGQFVTNSTTIQSPTSSSLVDGFLTVTEDDFASIDFEPSEKSLRFALQSGPVLRVRNAKRPLKLVEDEFARRSIAGITTDGSLIFISLYFIDQEYSGPRLERTPMILEKIMQRERIDIQDALNLDGGSASAFISNSVALTELAPIGGFFCIK